jgi:hypothetical protein
MNGLILEDFVEDLLGHKPKKLEYFLGKSLKRAYSSLHDDEEPEEEGEEEDINALIQKLYQKAKEEGATADMLKIGPDDESDSEAETKVAVRSEEYMRASFVEDLERYLDDFIAEEQISVPRWFKQYIQNLEPSNRKEMLSTLRGMSPEEQKQFISTKKGGEAGEKAAEFKQRAEKGREKIGGALAMGKSEKFDPTKASIDVLGTMKDKEGEEEYDPTKTMIPEPVGREEEPERAREPSDDEVVQFGQTIRSIDAAADDAVDRVTKLSAELQAFLNGQITAGELRKAADAADAVMDKLQRDASFLKKYAGVKEAVRKVAPEMARMIRRWAALAQSGREAEAGERTAVSSFPTLKAALMKALENWKGNKRDPEAAMNLWEVAGELAGQTEAIKGQINNLINAHDGNEKIRLAQKRGKKGEAPADVVKGARQLAYKLIGGTQAGVSPEETKELIKNKLEELVNTQGYYQSDIARAFGSNPGAVTHLVQYSGANVPGTAGHTPGGTAARRAERVPEELPGKAQYRVAGGELFGGGEDYYKKLWSKEADAAGVDSEVVTRVLRRMKEEGGHIDPDELAAELGIDRDKALRIMEKLPRKGSTTPTEDVRRTLFMPIERGYTHKQFAEFVNEGLDSDLLKETFAITDALETIMELAQ